MMKAQRLRRAAAAACVVALAAAHVTAQWGQDEGAAPASLADELFAIPAPPAPADVLMLKLRDGRIQWGAIGDHDTVGFTFQRLDNGGEVRVPWSLLDPRQSEQLRTDFGYVEVEAEEVFVDAERLLLEGGGTVEGVIVSREGDSFLVKTDGNLQRVPKRRVRGIESGVRLPALDVYGREELYTQFSSEADEESATSQLELARRCEDRFAADPRADATPGWKFAFLHITKPMRRAAQLSARRDWAHRSSVSDIDLYSSACRS